MAFQYRHERVTAICRKRVVPYGIQTLKRSAHRATISLAEARRAQELLAKGGVVGKIVLVRYV